MVPGGPYLTAPTRLREFKVLSSVLPFVGSDACLTYVPQFGAQPESLTISIPRFFLVESLSDFAEGLDEDLLLFPAHALRMSMTRGLVCRSRSPHRPSRAVS